jgi:hypothetical protein
VVSLTSLSNKLKQSLGMTKLHEEAVRLQENSEKLEKACKLNNDEAKKREQKARQEEDAARNLQYTIMLPEVGSKEY